MPRYEVFNVLNVFKMKLLTVKTSAVRESREFISV